jgi:hypothetical protein
VRHQFELAESKQTLAEGLAEYYAANPALKRGSDLQTPQARQFFESHDAVHVLYGCGTSMPDEAVVKLASLLGTTGGLGVLRGYLLYESRDIYRGLPLGETLCAVLMAPYLILRTIWRCIGQRQRWPWDQHHEYMHVPLHEIRTRFGIRVV